MPETYMGFQQRVKRMKPVNSLINIFRFPCLADTTKHIMGIEDLKESGLNLTAAVKLFGKEWFEQNY